MAFIEISIITSITEADAFADGLSELEALSVTLEDAKDDAIFQLYPDEQPLWQVVKVKALFNEDISPRGVVKQLKKLLKRKEAINYRIEKVADQDWVRLTQQHFKPQHYSNNFWICPNWYEEPLEGTVVRIDPGLAFGTGTHPTTHLCLEWLATHPPHQQDVIDYGCGSGILALAAVSLGAKHVYAVDHDEQALIASKNNSKLNPSINDSKLTIGYADILGDIKTDLIIANILSGPLMTLEPEFRRLLKPNSRLVLSGILEHEIQNIVHAYQDYFTLNKAETLDQWALLQFTPRTQSN